MVILDVWLQNSSMDGIEILEELKKRHPDLPVVIISGHGTIETAVAAIKKGAYDFVEKPFNADRLVIAVSTVRSKQRACGAKIPNFAKGRPDWGLIGSSSAVTNLRSVIERVADARSRVLISGPPGSGKEVIARLIHSASGRANQPFVVVSAATISPEKMEEELFGVENDDGSPGVVGLMEKAHGGTLMFDEIGDMPIETQNKILRVLVEQRFRRVGGKGAVDVDVRIISTSSIDLLAAAEEGRFREDLFHRLNVVSINAPGLDERREDIPSLAAYFIDRIARSAGLPKRPFSTEAMAALQSLSLAGQCPAVA